MTIEETIKEAIKQSQLITLDELKQWAKKLQSKNKRDDEWERGYYEALSDMLRKLDSLTKE